MSFTAFFVSVILAFVIGFIAFKCFPFYIPGQLSGAFTACFVGEWIGHGLLGNWGPVIAGFVLIPAIIGAIIFVCILSLIGEFF